MAAAKELSRAEKLVRYENQRRRRLPSIIDATRHKLRALENEAQRLGMTELLTNPEHLDRAWDREVDLARAANTEREGGK